MATTTALRQASRNAVARSLLARSSQQQCEGLLTVAHILAPGPVAVVGDVDHDAPRFERRCAGIPRGEDCHCRGSISQSIHTHTGGARGINPSTSKSN